MSFSALRFGTAGIPISTADRNTLNGIKRVNELGLGAMEMEFVHSVNISKESAPLVAEQSKKSDVTLTCHGQYYVNLNSKEPEKVEASKKRVLNAARIANLCGAYSLCFHAGFYQGMEKEKTYSNIKKQMEEITAILKKEKNPIWVRPETTGKPTQFGDLKELLQLSSELENVMPCIDFSHLHARTNGKFNTLEEFKSVLNQVEKITGKDGIKNIHAHVSGIAYSEKGEKHHQELKDSDFNYKALLKALKDFNAKGVVICESPNIEKDALLLQKAYG